MDRQVQEAETFEDYRGEHLPGYDERDGVCRPILRIRVGQDYRSGNVEGAKHPHPGPPWCGGDVTQSRYALADQKHHRPENERAHEKGDRRGRYRPSYRPAQLAIDGELYRYRGPRQNGEQRKQSLHLSSPSPVMVGRTPPYWRNRDRREEDQRRGISPLPACCLARMSISPWPAPPRAAVYGLRFGYEGDKVYRTSRQARRCCCRRAAVGYERRGAHPLRLRLQHRPRRRKGHASLPSRPLL